MRKQRGQDEVGDEEEEEEEKEHNGQVKVEERERGEGRPEKADTREGRDGGEDGRTDLITG